MAQAEKEPFEQWLPNPAVLMISLNLKAGLPDVTVLDLIEELSGGPP